MTTNWFAPEALIESAVREATYDKLPILRAGDLDETQDRAAELPALFLIYAGDQVSPPGGAGPVKLITQSWKIILCVAGPGKTGDRARDNAGPLIAGINNALQGLRLQSDEINIATPLTRSQGAAPLYVGSRAYFDLTFTVGIHAR